MPRRRSRAVDGPEYIRRLASARVSTRESTADTFSDVDDPGDDEDSCFTTKTIDSCDLDNIAGDIGTPPEAEDASISSDERSEVGGFAEDSTEQIATGEGESEGEDGGDTAPSAAAKAGGDASQRPPRGRSILHGHLNDGRVKFLSLDLETGGEECGMIQLSAEFVRPKLNRGGKTAAKDSLASLDRGEDVFHAQNNPQGTVFNEYVNPGEDAEWNDEAGVHGLSSTHPSIRSARKINEVWKSFCLFVDNNLLENEEGCVVAWNGAGSDMKWIWRLTQATGATESMPPKLKYFLDPFRVIKAYPSCRINPEHSGLKSLSLGAVWKHLNNDETLEGAHNSLVDAKAQSDILFHPLLITFLDRSKSVVEISKVFNKNQLKDLEKENEPKLPVHEPWFELVPGDGFHWSPPPADEYTGVFGGGAFGPSSTMRQAARTAKDLSALFFLMMPLVFWREVARLSHKYCYTDWVVEKIGKDRDGNKKKMRYFEDVPPLLVGRTKNKRHRVEEEKQRFKITTGFVLCFMAHLLLQGAHFGSTKPGSERLYRKGRYGISVPQMRNMMTRDAYTFMRRHLHFADNHKHNPKGSRGYDPLYKVAYPLETIQAGLNAAWIAGQHVTIDESMIKYMGRAVSWMKQYCPAKPIKHGIKVFCLCCVYTGVVLAFKFYLGTEEETDGSALAICLWLCEKADLLKTRGRVLFTDNWYTTMALAKHMYENHGWTIVGTYVPTKKKHREKHDFPFLRLSNGARNKLPRGWFREAGLKLRAPSGRVYYIQASVWRDKKQVCFLSTMEVAASAGLIVLRHVKHTLGRVALAGVRAHAAYVKYMNAVDRNDRDSADYSTSFRSNRFYLRIYCRGLDMVIHCLYQIVCFCATNAIGPEEWKAYLDSHEGRREFQIDLALDIMNYALSLEWDGDPDKRPDYVRKDAFTPCDCEKCFFCVHGLTSGIAHAGIKRKAVFHYQCGGRQVTDGCTDVRVNLGLSGSDYCRMCYRKLDDSLSTKEKKKAVKKFSQMGCNQCREPICKGCWDEGYDRHQK